jgi:dolichyl-phosphate beta-glucosyltransferase
MKKLKKSFKINYNSIVIPLYNEEVRLDYCFKIIEKFLKNKGKLFFEIIFVNDGSTDQSKNKILKFIKKNKKKFFSTKIKLISYTKNMGKGYALKRGIFSSKADWIVTCDLDMSVLPEQYLIWKRKKLIKDINCAYIASRIHGKSKVKSKFLRRRLGGIFRLILFLMFNIRILDTQCGFKVYHKNYIKNVFKRMKIKRYAHDVEIMLILKSIGIRIVELPVKWTHHPDSKINVIIDSLKMILDLFILRLRLVRMGNFNTFK